MRHRGHNAHRPEGATKLVRVHVYAGQKCRTCGGKGWIDEECESAIAGVTVPRHLRPICDDCEGTGVRPRGTR